MRQCRLKYRRGQAQGDIYVNKTEIRHGTIEQMSKEEVMKALNELKQTYAPLTHDAGEQRMLVIENALESV